MARSMLSWLSYGIIGLAILGLGFQLITNPLNLFKSILFIVALSAIIFGLFYFLFFRQRYASNEMKKYKQAVKQSQRKYKTNSERPPLTKRPSQIMQRKRRRRHPHLRVIHGKKSKKRNRANF